MDENNLSDKLRKEFGYKSLNITKYEYPIESAIIGRNYKKINAEAEKPSGEKMECLFLIDEKDKVIFGECKRPKNK
jgi:hypothetical protein